MSNFTKFLARGLGGSLSGKNPQGVRRRGRRGPAKPPFVKLRLESLEDRVVPSTIVLGPSKDNTLYESTSATSQLSNGAGPTFFVGETGGRGGDALRRGVIAFDIASNIPAGSTINSVTLSLHVVRDSVAATANESVELHRLSADWGEGTSNAGADRGGVGAPATTNDATWLYRFFNTTTWANPGGGLRQHGQHQYLRWRHWVL